MLLGRSMKEGRERERPRQERGFFFFFSFCFRFFFFTFCVLLFLFLKVFFLNIAFVQGSDRGVTLDWLCRALFTLSLLFLLQVEAFLYIMFIILFNFAAALNVGFERFGSHIQSV